ncbi:universal stress protein [Acuticoccus sp. M5D2P5]|uniref:universal stress protein n=1 Tax=Acuticoccus kalidii TaxID=2910977 RepID=UPI001F46BEC1|nr:universal stress protein [Acuticoccus kalidii]MCF3932517.1 universal stress protein [Acuticoccus kalidii]
MTKVIALIDGSIYSQSVCDHAAWAAKRIETPVEIVHVLGRREAIAPADLSGSIGLGARTALLEELAALDTERAKLIQKRGRAILAAARERMEADGVTEIQERLRHGDLIETVNELEEDARLVVIGKRGEAADFAKLHLGSNLERVVRSSMKPVLVANRAFKEITSYVIAFDGGTSAMKAVDMAGRSPFFAGLKGHILMVGQPTVENQRKLDGAKALAAAGGGSITTSLEQGQPEEAITNYIDREGCDLLVMGAYGHSRMRTLIIGSTTSEMVRACRVPVLLFR